MRFLPDTPTVIWWLIDDARLSADARTLLEDERHELLFSAAVAWEISIKRALGKLRAPDRYADVLLDEGATPLAISLQHADAAGRLRPHHRDPFDRLLIAQAQIEDAVLVTADEAFAPYDVRVAW